ncbi:hypothetical protein EXN66_Car006853 [Channa argus]|uniref:Uncharacterized protein n=1 Tax=Channa argus TaxID=215402 RepID=A0A6G1PMG5_CHAAH|nr:hypothetical protein EXN66_Car006853 [Channa argus]
MQHEETPLQFACTVLNVKMSAHLLITIPVQHALIILTESYKTGHSRNKTCLPADSNSCDIS